MSKVLFFKIFLLLFVATIYPQSNSWRGIVPLKSTRSDVEKLESIKSIKETDYFPYQTETEFVKISYADDRCKGSSFDWNVPKDTVLRITVSDKNLDGKSFDELKLDKNKFAVAVDDAVFGTWTNAEDGLQYYFRDVSQRLEYIRYIPKKSDTDLRCIGFPPYDAVSESYYAAEYFSTKDWRDAAIILEKWIVRVKEFKNEYTAYFVFYEGNDFKGKKFRQYFRKVRNFLSKDFNASGINPERIKFIEGGRRAESIVVAYVLPNEWQTPTPLPTLPSPQFMKSKKK